MTRSAASERLHIEVSGDGPRELGRARGAALRGTLPEAYAKYAELFRLLGVGEPLEREGVGRVLDALGVWRPACVDELVGIAEGSGLDLEQVVALNARTELIALGGRASAECSTVAATLGGHRYGVQTWDWHIELDPFWHTHVVRGPGLAFAGLTEQGIVAKIGVNEAGLGLHFNILGHRDDGPNGVPMHVLAKTVLCECRSVDEALALIREAPIRSSSAFTLLDVQRSVSAELSPDGVFVIDESGGSVQRTNHFQHPTPLAAQKHETYEPDSSERLALIRERLAGGLPADTAGLVALLRSGEGEPPLTCRADMALPYGERWATLATIVTDPEARTVSILDGAPPEAETGSWRTLTP
ncbi:MAG: hypothetical protein KDB25_04105 [Leucobacter sp.]|nr:hypothetical protein [Leucobacter sp.]